MKKSGLFILVLVAFLGASCSKCYDCTRQIAIEVDKDGDGVKETEFVDDTDEVCTANRGEVDDKENEGYTCS